MHFPKTFNELMHSQIALTIGTALLATAVLCAYSVMMNADGNYLLAEAAKNLIQLLS